MTLVEGLLLALLIIGAGSVAHWIRKPLMYKVLVMRTTVVMGTTVDSNPGIPGGEPVLMGRRFTVAQVLAELAESSGPKEVAEQFDLDEAQIRTLLYDMSIGTVTTTA